MTRRKARWRARFWGMGVEFRHLPGLPPQGCYAVGSRRQRRVKKRLAKKLWKRRLAIGEVILRKWEEQMARECGVVPDLSRQIEQPLQIDWLVACHWGPQDTEPAFRSV